MTAQSLLRRGLRLFFHHFYHGLAWTYDAVAWGVSLGRWYRWIAIALPYVRGNRLLELGHGPGHLQVALQQGTDALVVGLDESAQMARLARRRLAVNGSKALLVRGLGQQLPFASASIHTIVATFPTEYIFAKESLQEVRRVLVPRGRLVVIPGAWITGPGFLDRLVAWIFRVTHQAPEGPLGLIADQIRGPLRAAGYEASLQEIRVARSAVLVVIAVPIQLLAG